MFGPITPMRYLIGSMKGLMTRLVSGLWEWVGKMLERVEGSSSWVISRECTWVALLEPDQAITQLGATTSTPPTARCIAATFGHSLKHPLLLPYCSPSKYQLQLSMQIRRVLD